MSAPLRWLPLLLLPLACLAAWGLRERAGGEGASRAVLDEPSAAALRRVELALAGGAVPTADRFLDPPNGAPFRDPPLAAGVLSALARFRLARPAGPAELGGVEEEALERWSLHLPPRIAVLVVLGVFFVVQALTGRAAPAAVAAAAYALAPSAVAVEAGGRLAPGAVGSAHALLAALAFLALIPGARARDPLDLLLAGILSGLVAGLGLATGPEALAWTPLAWLVFLVVARRAARQAAEGDGSYERALAARRAGLFFALVTAVVCGLASGRVPGDGPAARWLRGASELAFAAGVPFALGLFAAERVRRRVWLRTGFAFGAAATVVLLPLGLANVGRSLLPALAAARVDVAGLVPALPVLALALVAAALLRRAAVEARLVAGAAAAWGLAALAFPSLAPLAALAAAAALALAWDAARRRDPRGSSIVNGASAGAAALLVAFAAQDLATAPARPDPELLELRRGLRWMRAGTPSPGPWNSSTARPDWSVLAPPAFGRRVAYDGRRPPTASGDGPRLDAGRRRDAARALTAAEPGLLAREMERLGAAFVVTGALACREWPRLERAAGVQRALEDSALWRLSLPDGADLHEGFALAWASENTLPVGRASLPAVVLLRVQREGATERDAPSLRAR